MRLAPASGAHGQFVSQHWGRWFGTVSRESFTRLEWENGFVSRATIRTPIAVPLFTLRVMRFVRELSISLPFDAPLSGLDALPRLRHLRVSLPWGHSLGELRPAFEKLSSIELALSGLAGSGDLGLLSWPLPALKHFILDAGSLPQQTLGALTACPWLRQLESLVLCDVGNENAGPLLNRSGAFAALGAGLHLDLASDGLPAQRDALRKKLPLATMRLSEAGSVRGLYVERGPYASKEPRRAPRDFGSRPPRMTRVSDDVEVSSGESGYRNVCAHCASDHTLLIFKEWFHPDWFRADVHDWHHAKEWRSEWRCTDCGWFSGNVRTG